MIGRVLAWLFPSVPPAEQAIVLAAMEGRTQTPVVGARGRASATGQTTAIEPTPGGGAASEDGTGAVLSSVAVPFSGAPACETQVAFYPHPANRWDLSDDRLWTLVDRWAVQS